MQDMKTWTGYWGNLELGRYPLDDQDPALQAWNGADRLMAAWLEGSGLGSSPNARDSMADPQSGASSRGTLLILNDAWGALCCLGVRLGFRVIHVTDSWMSMKSVEGNMAHNGLASRGLTQVLSGGDLSWTQDLDLLAALAPGLDAVLVHMPRNLDLLDWQLGGIGELAGSVALDCPLVLGAMDKDLVARARAAMDRRFGSHQLSRGEFKAHLATALLVPGRKPEALKNAGRAGADKKNDSDQSDGGLIAGPWPLRISVPGHEGLELFNWPGVFSRDGIDPAGLLLLETIQKSGLADLSGLCAGRAADTPGDTDTAGGQSSGSRPLVIELGCGNGLLALGLARKYPGYRYLCTDESAAALDSARAGYRQLSKSMEIQMDFLLADCLAGLADGSAALILCNPPFHILGAQGLGVAARMFADSARVLEPGGILVVVANRHLGHHRNLEKWFSLVEVMADNGNFMVIKATGPGK